MSKIIFLFLSFQILSILTFSQNKPNGLPLPAPSSAVNPLPPPYSNSNLFGYSRTWDVKMPSTSMIDILQSTSVKDVEQSTVYTDGLGNVVQSVNRGITPNGKDIVLARIYDNVGREKFKYLPYPSTTGDGKIKQDPFAEQAAYFQSQPQYSGEQVFYNKTDFDNSPLSEVEKTMHVGNSYAGSNRGAQAKYESNVLNEVRVWSVVSNINATPTLNGFYDPATLYRGIFVDVNGKRVVNYKDKEGRLLLKKVEITTSTAANITDIVGWLCTYYVYDDVCNLRYNITPRAVEWLQASGWISMPANILDNLCFRYEYDDKKRLIVSKSPGAAEVCSVYDTKDRPILYRDGILLAQNLWQYTFYDNQSRVIEKGLWTNSQTRDYHQAQADVIINYPINISGNQILEQIYSDDYSFINSCGCGLSATFDGSQLNGGWLNTTTSSQFPYPLPLVQTQQTLNFTTITKTRVMDVMPAKYLYSVIFYDNYGNSIQTISTNITGGNDIVTNQFGYGGKVLATHTQHTYVVGAVTQTQNIYSRLEYDDAGRVLKTFKRINNDPEKIQTNNTYNEQSQLVKTELGKNSNTGLPIETVDYSYTISGSLKGLNESFVNGTTSDRFFGEVLNRDYGFTQPQYNGNIAGIQWRSLGDGERRAYGYSYDAANRVLNAEFTQYTGGWNTTANIDFTQKLGDGVNPNTAYDANSNILSMSQKALLMYQSDWVDKLVYKYENNNYSNKLKSIDETSFMGTDALAQENVLGDFKDNGIVGQSYDYSYDENGNINMDFNKGITNIVYNFLNSPTQIDISQKGSIKYIYDATGIRLQKIVIPFSGSTITYNYVGGFTYRNDQLQFIITEQGRMRPLLGSIATGQPSFAYDYFEKDHLGSIRAILTDEQKTDFYVKATFEDANIPNEQLYYDNVNVSLAFRPNSFGTPNNNGGKVQLLQKTGQSIGVGKLMKVMVKDRINVSVEYYFPSAPVNNGGANGASSILNMLTTLLNFPNAPSSLLGKGTEISQQLNSSITSPFNTFLTPQNTSQASSLPKAYLNILFFDEQFRFVGINSTFVGVTVSGSLQTIVRSNIEAPKNGYVYLFVSNESNNPVFFDNFQVAQIRGPLLEENHYNLFGAKMTALCSKANPGFANCMAYQGKCLDEEFDLDWSDFGARNYDAQIGRFMQLDPADQFASGYVGMGNNWVNGTDPTGAFFGLDDALVAAVGFVYGYVSSGIKNGDWGLKAVGNGLLQAALFEFGYLTAGGGLAATGGAATATSVTAAGLSTTAAQTVMNTASTYLVNTAVNIAVGQILPPIPIQFGSLTILISPSLSTSGAGVNIGATVSDGDFSIGASFGFGISTGTNDLSGNFKNASKGIYSSHGGNFGLRLN